MKIVLIGRSGQLGRALQAPLARIGQVLAWDRHDLDLQDLDAIDHQLGLASPEVIVNAAAYTAVDQAESHTELASTINATAVARMADYAARTNALLLHYSTDYVFDGQQSAPYIETDATHPLNVYGRSKLAGEQAIAQSACRSLIFRSSWLFSAHGKNFIKTILALAQTRETLNVVADQHGAPTSADWLAEVSALAIGACQAQRLNTGLYHVSATGQTTWHGLACHAIARARNQGMALKTASGQILPVLTKDYPLPAVRPKNSCLNSKKISDTLALHLPDWSGAVDTLVDHLCRQDQTASRP